MRIDIDLTERERQTLDSLAETLNVHSDVLVREAVRQFLIRNRQAVTRTAVSPSEGTTVLAAMRKSEFLNG